MPTTLHPIKIKGFEHLYSVNSLGQVLSRRMNRIIKPHKNAKGFLMIYLTGDEKTKEMGVRNTNKTVSRLVMDCFGEPPPNNSGQMHIGYIDGDKTNVCINNLCWISHGDVITLAITKAKTKDEVVNGRLPGFIVPKEVKKKMSLAKQRPVIVDYNGGSKRFDSVEDMVSWDVFPFKMYRMRFMKILKDGGEYMGFKFRYL